MLTNSINCQCGHKECKQCIILSKDFIESIHNKGWIIILEDCKFGAPKGYKEIPIETDLPPAETKVKIYRPLN